LILQKPSKIICDHYSQHLLGGLNGFLNNLVKYLNILGLFVTELSLALHDGTVNEQ
jgi:hypothetical protein